MQAVKTPWEPWMGTVPMHLDYFQGTMAQAVARIAEKPQSFFNYALERDFLLVGLEPYRREKSDKILADKALQVFHPGLSALEILCDNKHVARPVKKTPCRHHGRKRD